MNKVVKIFPTEEELSTVCTQVQCPIENCYAVFKSTSNLNMHTIKHHKIQREDLCKKESEREYYCPCEACIYSKDSKKHFKKLKYLKQHYLKVHAVKNFLCSKCGKGFATESFKSKHVKTCGSTFTCRCGHVYNSSEALLTHCKRKGHVNTPQTDENLEERCINKERDTSENWISKKSERLICPKLMPDISHPVHYIAAVALSELSSLCNLSKVVDKGIQTEFYRPCFWKGLKHSNSNNSGKKQNSSQQTQTVGRSKNVKISAETQTNGDYLKLKLKSPSKASTKKRKISMETQTKELLNFVWLASNVKPCESKILFNKGVNGGCNKDEEFYNDEMLAENFKIYQDIPQNCMSEGSNSSQEVRVGCLSSACLNNMPDKSFPKNNDIFNKDIRNISDGREGLFNNSSELNMCGKVFETDLTDEMNVSCKKMNNEHENPYLVGTGSYNVFDINKLCNIETQTEIDNFLTDCNDDSFTLCSTTETQTTDFDSLLYSNMCTQTCDDVDQLFNFNFVDIETQTAWPDFHC